MLLSKSCIYGLRASLYLAYNKDDGYISIKEMAKELDISFHFLTKILQQLTAEGYMESYKGPNGGIKLSIKGLSSTLFDFVTTIDGEELFTECVLGLPGCGASVPCALHENWISTREGIVKMLQDATIRDIAQKGLDEGLRIKLTICS